MFNRLCAGLACTFLAAGCGASAEDTDASSDEAALRAPVATRQEPRDKQPQYTGQIYVASSQAAGTGIVVDVTEKYDVDAARGCTREFVDGYALLTCGQPTPMPGAQTFPVNLGTVRVWSDAARVSVPWTTNQQAPWPSKGYYEDFVDPSVRLWNRAGEPIHTAYSLPSGKKVTTRVPAPEDGIVVTGSFPRTLPRQSPLEVRWTGASPRDVGFVEITLLGGLNGDNVLIKANAAPHEGRVKFSKKILDRLPLGDVRADVRVRSSAVDEHGVEHNLFARAGGVTEATLTKE